MEKKNCQEEVQAEFAQVLMRGQSYQDELTLVFHQWKHNPGTRPMPQKKELKELHCGSSLLFGFISGTKNQEGTSSLLNEREEARSSKETRSRRQLFASMARNVLRRIVDSAIRTKLSRVTSRETKTCVATLWYLDFVQEERNADTNTN